MKIIISLGLASRITRLTLESIVSKSFTLGAKRKFWEEQNRTLLLAGDAGKFADSWVRRHAGADYIDPCASTHCSSFSEIEERDLLQEFVKNYNFFTNSCSKSLSSISEKEEQ